MRLRYRKALVRQATDTVSGDGSLCVYDCRAVEGAEEAEERVPVLKRWLGACGGAG